uniref:Tic22-like family protein n=1 Tax=Araucaria cunninghamii TaxID=56994 RepID=A0A0D6R651_ARACU
MNVFIHSPEDKPKMRDRLIESKMQTQPKGLSHQKPRNLLSIELKQPPFVIFSAIQQQWKGAQEQVQSHFSNCINQVQQNIQKIQGPNIVPVLGLRLIKLRGPNWHTQMKKTLETVGTQVGQTLNSGKEKFAERFGMGSAGIKMWACNSVTNSHFEARHLFDLAMSSEDVSRRLDGIPVYTVSNSANEFVLVSDMNNERSFGLFCFKQQDAEDLLSQVYELRKQGIAFRFLPDPIQVKNALEAASKSGVAGQSFPGVPVFQSDNLVIRSKNKQFRPLFFIKEDLEGSLRQAFEQQKQLNPSFKVSTDIQVGSFEDVIQRMENIEDSSTWEDIVFIPPGLDIFNQTGKQVSA